MMKSPLAAKTTPLFLLQLNCSVFNQLQIEEALLRADTSNWCVINRGAPPAIVMGISGKQELLVNPSMQTQYRVPVIRRFSGGGTVFIDQNTWLVSWICNATCSGIDCFPAVVHDWTKCFYQAALPSLSLQLRENDYVIGEKKCGGNAQYFRKNRWLHHTSLLWDYDPANMDYLLMPQKMPHYRNQRIHDEFLCRLKDFYPDKMGFEGALSGALMGQFEVREKSFEDVAHLLDGAHRKATCLL